jgi:hypothetical protein
MITRLTSTLGFGSDAPKSPSSEALAPLRVSRGPLPFRMAKFGIGQVVRHRVFAFRGVIFDVDPVFANTEDWWLAIPAEVRPR